MKQNLAFFDFCGTLVNFQTADNFIHFIRKNEGKSSMYLEEGLRKILKKSGLIYLLENITKKPLNKKLVLWQIKGLNINKLEKYANRYYTEIIKINFNREVLGEMKRLKKKKYKIYIVSAGYNLYLKYFVKEFKLDGLICTRILFKNNMCIGAFDGEDCRGEMKVKLIKKYISNKVYKENTISYSDSIDDLPLLKLAKKGIVVSRKKSSIWARKYGFKEIICKI